MEDHEYVAPDVPPGFKPLDKGKARAATGSEVSPFCFGVFWVMMMLEVMLGNVIVR